MPPIKNTIERGGFMRDGRRPRKGKVIHLPGCALELGEETSIQGSRGGKESSNGRYRAKRGVKEGAGRIEEVQKIKKKRRKGGLDDPRERASDGKRKGRNRGGGGEGGGRWRLQKRGAFRKNEGECGGRVEKSASLLFQKIYFLVVGQRIATRGE